MSQLALMEIIKEEFVAGERNVFLVRVQSSSHCLGFDGVSSAGYV